MRVELKRVSASHTGHNVDRPGHLAISENGDLLCRGANQFNGPDGALGVLGGNIDDDHFRPGILKLPQNRIGRTGRVAHMAENGASQARRLQAGFERR